MGAGWPATADTASAESTSVSGQRQFLRAAAEGADGRGLLLLPGDISQLIEQRLVREQPSALPAQVLVMPHRQPDLVIGSFHRCGGTAARADRCRSPQPLRPAARGCAGARYIERGIALDDTARHGAIHLLLDADADVDVPAVPRYERLARPRLWREN